MIKRVRIKGYKSLEQIDIEFQPLTVVFGPNAAGKSNLFDALGLLSRMVRSETTLSKAFEGHRGLPLEAFYWDERGLEGMLKKPTAQFSIAVDVELSDDVVQTVEQQIRLMREGVPATGATMERPRRSIVERRLRYELTVEIITVSGYLRVADERLVALNRDGTERKSRSAFIERVGDRLRLRMEGRAGHPIEQDIGLDYTLVSRPLYAPYYPHVTAFKEELSRWHFYYLEPREMMRADNPLKDINGIGPHGEDLAAFFNSLKANNPAAFEALNRTLNHVLPMLQELDVERTRDGLLHLKVREGDTRFPARVISEGTLRVLGLLAITNPRRPAAVIGYEEPENGVHPRRLKIIADLLKTSTWLGQTQILVNTHSPLLPDYFDNKSLIVCQKEGHRTTFTPFTSIGPLFRPLEIDQAFEEPPTPISVRIARGDFGG